MGRREAALVGAETGPTGAVGSTHGHQRSGPLLRPRCDRGGWLWLSGGSGLVVADPNSTRGRIPRAVPVWVVRTGTTVEPVVGAPALGWPTIIRGKHHDQTDMALRADVHAMEIWRPDVTVPCGVVLFEGLERWPSCGGRRQGDEGDGSERRSDDCFFHVIAPRECWHREDR